MFKNTDSFREAALYFKEHKVYTKLPHGSRSWELFWKEETDRCLNGFTANGYRISGQFYYYLNYHPIYLVHTDADKNVTRELDFPFFWDSDAYFFEYLDECKKQGKHAVVLKCRARGYSFKMSGILNRNYHLIPGSKSYAIAAEKEYLVKDGIMNKSFEAMDHINANTPWAKRRHYKDTDMHRRASYRITREGKPIEMGFKSEIIGISLKNDANKARGKRGINIIFEEAGKMPNLIQAFQISRPSVEQGRKTYGTIIVLGTGGVEGGSFEGLRELFENPNGYNILPYDNPYLTDPVIQKGMFIPEYMNLEGYMDSDGNSLVLNALKSIQEDRKIVLENTRDRHAYKRYLAEKPIVPEEAMMKLSGNMFPVMDLQGVLARLELDKEYERKLYKGYFNLNQEGKPEFIQDNSSKIIYDYPLKKENNTDAPCIIYEQPFQYNDLSTPSGLYIAGCDPYDHDQSGTGSLGSCFIINKLNKRIVAEYTARPQTSKHFYEQVRRLLVYYNARMLYENQNKGIFDYFESKNALYLLCEEPSLIQDIVKKPSPSRKFGTKMSDVVKRHAENVLYNFLVEEVDDTGKQNLNNIRSIGLLKELIQYDGEKNTDRVSAMFTVVLQLEEERRYIVHLERDDKVTPFHKRGFFASKNIPPPAIARN